MTKEERDEKIDKIYDSWKDQLSEIPADRRRQIAVLLENQKLFDDQVKDSDSKLKNSIEIIKFIFTDFVPFDMISFEPMLRPSDNIFYRRYDGTTSKLLQANTKLFKTRYNNDMVENEMFAKQLRNEITQEIMTDLRNNAGTVIRTLSPTDPGRILANLMELNGVITKKTGNTINWIITGTEIAEKLIRWSPLKELPKIHYTTNVTKINSVWNLIVNPQLPQNEILCGVKKEMLDGYFYCPYILLNESQIEVNGNRIVNRLSKFLVNGKSYGRIYYE